jgi:SAM-dependent methyltransferase
MLKSWKEHYWYTIPCARVRIEEIVRRARGSYTILECGCNEGFLAAALREEGFHVTAIDKDPAEVFKANEFFGLGAQVADVNELPYLDNQFDLVIGGELLEHLDNPGKGLAEMFRVSNSRVILSLPIGEYWLGEKSHKWQIDSTIIEHDHGAREELIKTITILEFKKRVKNG